MDYSNKYKKQILSRFEKKSLLNKEDLYVLLVGAYFGVMALGVWVGIH